MALNRITHKYRSCFSVYQKAVKPYITWNKSVRSPETTGIINIHRIVKIPEY